MESQKKRLLEALDIIEAQQREISECHDYYRRLEKDLEEGRKGQTNPEDLSSLTKDIEMLNRGYEEKIDLMYEELNAALLKGHDLAEAIGHEVAHDFKKLWDYMTDSVRHEIKLEKVLEEIARIKNDFLV